jgi:Periplasmic binding protein
MYYESAVRPTEQEGGQMTMRQWLVIGLVMASTWTLGGAARAQSGGTDEPEATEVGITDSEIRIAVIADDENSLRPGIFHAAPVAVEAFAKYVNANGGLAGRKLVVDFIDSHLSPDDVRTAIIKACAEDFAMIGTTALFLNNVDDMVACTDKEGTATGLPDIPAFATEIVHQCSPVSYAITPSFLDCSTKDSAPQTWSWNAGRVRYEQKKFGEKLHGAYVFSNDLRASTIAGLTIGRAVQAAGVKSDGEFGVSARATQSTFTPIVQQMKDASSNFVQVIAPGDAAVALRKEAKLQGIDPNDVVWDCGSQCYSPEFLEQGGADVEGTYAGLNQLPFEEAKHNKTLAAYVKSAGKENINGFGSYAWIASVLFRDTVNAIVEKSGVNGVTRQAFLDQLAATKKFNAGGMTGTVNIGDRVPTPCYMLLQVKNGKYVRVHPTKPATFDCAKKNLVTYEDDLLGT